jgi:hypothetical protein
MEVSFVSPKVLKFSSQRLNALATETNAKYRRQSTAGTAGTAGTAEIENAIDKSELRDKGR